MRHALSQKRWNIVAATYLALLNCWASRLERSIANFEKSPTRKMIHRGRKCFLCDR